MQPQNASHQVVESQKVAVHTGNDDYISGGEIGEVLNLYSGIKRYDGARNSLESTNYRQANLQQLYKHSGRDSFENDGSSRTIAPQLTLPENFIPPSTDVCPPLIHTLGGTVPNSDTNQQLEDNKKEELNLQ